MKPAFHTLFWPTALIALGAAAWPSHAAQAAPLFDVQAITNPAQTDFCEAVALTDAPWLVARCGGAGGGGFHRTPTGPWQAIPSAPDGSSSYGVKAANNAGMVTGTHPVGVRGNTVAYLWSEAGGYQYLTRATQRGYVTVEDINDLGQVVGEEGHNAMLWNADGSIGYRDPVRRGGFDYSYARRINNAEEVLVNDLGQHHACWTAAGGQRPVWADGHKLRYLGDLNNTGQLVGSYTVRDAHNKKWRQRVLASRDGTGLPVGPLRREDDTGPAHLNDAGQVIYLVGQYGVGEPVVTHYWDAASGDHELTALINPASPLAGRVELVKLGLINNLGQILSDGKDTVTGERQLYLFTPVAR